MSNSASMRRTASRASGEITLADLALRLAPGVGGDIGQDEERPAGMHPACRLGDRPGLALGLV